MSSVPKKADKLNLIDALIQLLLKISENFK